MHKIVKSHFMKFYRGCKMTAIYVRQSADRADSVSLETQEALCRRELAPQENAAVYADRGCSGKSADRPALQQMLRDIRAGKVQRVLVYKLDRISRNLADFTQLLTLFRQHGIPFSSHTERFETDTPMGQAMQSMLMVFAQLERETICGRVRDAAFARAKLGFDTGGPPPFGFCRQDFTLLGRHTHILAPNARAETVRAGFTRYLSAGESLRSLADAWNRADIRTARGGIWSAGTLCRLLRNPVYAQADAAVYAYLSARGAVICAPEPLPEARAVCLYADRRFNHSRFTDLREVLAICAPHQGIVPPEIWLACQQKLDAVSVTRPAGSGLRTWLSGRIFCGICGSAMTVTRGRSQDYLICAGKKRGRCAGAGAVWRVGEAETLVGEALQHRLHELADHSPPDPPHGEAHQLLETLTLRRERILHTMTECDDASLPELAEAAARLSARCEALRRGMGHPPHKETFPLPQWDACDAAARKTISHSLLRCVVVRGNLLQVLLQ